MNDDLWMMAQQTRSLQVLRADVGLVWTDSASQDLNGRYFDHHHSVSEAMQDALAQRQHSEELAENELAYAAESGKEAEARAMRVQQLVHAVDQDIELAIDEYGQYVTYEGRADATSREAENLIRLVNQLQ